MGSERAWASGEASRYGSETALLVVGLQNDFAHPDGSLFVPGADSLVPYINFEARQARAARAHVFYAQDWHPRRTPHFAKDGGIWPVHCVAGTWGAEFVEGLELLGEPVLKGLKAHDGCSAFTEMDTRTGALVDTGLTARLRSLGVVRVVVVGVPAEDGVKETALDARRLGLGTTVLCALTRTANRRQPTEGTRALELLRMAGVAVVTHTPSRVVTQSETWVASSAPR